MKIRTGLVAGAAVGYYFGAKAGRERYEQLSRVVRRAARSGALRAGVTTGVAKARAAAELGVERIRDLASTGDASETTTARILRLESSRPDTRRTEPNRAEPSRAEPSRAEPSRAISLPESGRAAGEQRRYY